MLALVFGGAAFAGSALTWPCEPAPRTPDGGMGYAHGDSTAGAAAPVRGLAVSDEGLTLELARPTARRDEPSPCASGQRTRRPDVRDFDVEHTKRMHLIVVRRDMTGFQHLHPTHGGRWHLDAWR